MSLFKVYLSATVLVSDCPTTYVGLCQEPIYDKGKYELKIKNIHPPIICNGFGYEISIVLDKSSGDVPLVFRIIDQSRDVVAIPGINFGYIVLRFR